MSLLLTLIAGLESYESTYKVNVFMPWAFAAHTMVARTNKQINLFILNVNFKFVKLFNVLKNIFMNFEPNCLSIYRRIHNIYYIENKTFF